MAKKSRVLEIENENEETVASLIHKIDINEAVLFKAIQWWDHYSKDVPSEVQKTPIRLPIYDTFEEVQKNITAWDGEFVKDMDVLLLRDLVRAAYILGDDNLMALTGYTIIDRMEEKHFYRGRDLADLFGGGPIEPELWDNWYEDKDNKNSVEVYHYMAHLLWLAIDQED